MIKEKHAWFAEVWQQMKNKTNKSLEDAKRRQKKK